VRFGFLSFLKGLALFRGCEVYKIYAQSISAYFLEFKQSARIK